VDRNELRSRRHFAEVVGPGLDGDGEAGGLAGPEVDTAVEDRLDEDPPQGGAGGGTVALSACAVGEEAREL
jgi:hypothetical protein